jgi:protein-S-isoprenylcysteine O-methyltransferase Ste14
VVAIQPGHTLVTNDPYRVIRHPSYAGLLVNALGGLVFRSGVGLVLTLLMAPPRIARIRAEEVLLRGQFGGECDAYCARTSRLLRGIY